MKRTLAVLAILVVSVLSPMAAMATTNQEAQAYSGSHVSFETESNAVVNYTVDGTETFESVRVDSQSSARSEFGMDASANLSLFANITGAALSLQSQSEAQARATVTTESGATIDANDNGHGSLVVTASDDSQYVVLNTSGSAEVESESENRVVFTTEDGTTATAIVVGEGEVAMSGDGNLTASLESESSLAVRTYGESRTDSDAEQERMIANGTAAASVYLMQEGDEQVTNTVTYAQDTTVNVSQRAEGQVNMTVERAESEGRVVITHVSEETFESAEDVQVMVDGEAAASASSYAELRQAANGGDSSAYMVEQSSSASASASADVLVGINHFSTRNVGMTDSSDQSGGDGSDGDDPGETETSSGGPGFGVAVALVALLAAAAAFARTRQ